MARRAAVVVDTDMGFDRIIKDLSELQKYSVVVGVQEGTLTHVEVRNGRKQKAGISIAQYAAQNEFGTRTIPERSFMRTAFDENINTIERFAAIQIGLVIDGESSIRQAFGLIGQAMQGMIQRKIRQINSPPNSPRTIAEKGSSKPLIDFGQMIASIRYAIRKRQVRN